MFMAISAFKQNKNLSFFFLCNCQCIGHGVSKLRNDSNLENYETVKLS